MYRATLVIYLVPLLGVSLGAIFLKEAVDWRLVAGFGLIVSGIVLLNRRSETVPALEEAW
jgi:drug/metabolite transporter (DMT)-like permease